jgi:hypothetical protein
MLIMYVLDELLPRLAPKKGSREAECLLSAEDMFSGDYPST